MRERRGRPEGARRAPGLLAMVRLVAALLAALVAVLFAVENDQPVRLVFAGHVFPAAPLPVLIFGALLLGALAVALIGSVDLLRLRRHAAALERALAARGGGAPASGPTAADAPPPPGAPPPAEPVAAGSAVPGDEA